MPDVFKVGRDASSMTKFHEAGSPTWRESVGARSLACPLVNRP